MFSARPIPSAIVALGLLASACATNPATGQREFSLMSEQQEISIGQQMDVEVRREMGVYDDPDLQQYVSGIGLKLAKSSERPNLPWHFAIVDSPAVNAFALPGGYIYLARGILPFLEDEAQLAGVLGHEIGHVTARHSAQQYSRATGAQLGLILGSIFVPAVRPFGQLAQASLGVLFLKYGREDELQADALGVRYTARTGWDPAGVAGMLSTLDRLEETTTEKGIPNWLATHPAPADRVEKVQAAVHAASAEATRTAPVDRNDFLRRIDGLVYGDNPDQGVVRGNNRFLHAALRFSLDFPSGWDVNNSASQVVAKQPQADVFIVLQLVQQPTGRTVEQVALNAMQQAGFRAREGSRTTINSLDAFVGTYEGVLEDLGRVGVRAAHVVHERNVYMIAGLAPVQLFSGAERDLNASIRSFRALTAAQAEEIRPNRIDLYTVRDGDTWESIAQRQSEGLVKPTTLAIMNGRVVTERPRPGERLKIVVTG
jgi:predicted Zn-dependent protease